MIKLQALGECCGNQDGLQGRRDIGIGARDVCLHVEDLRILTEHRQRSEERCAEMGEPLLTDAFVFSLAPDGSTHLRPNSVSER